MSLLRRIIEIILTVLLNLLTLFFLLLLVDSIATVMRGRHLIFSWVPDFVLSVNWLGFLAVVILIIYFFLLASAWMFFKSKVYPTENQKKAEPKSVTDEELSEYFKLPLEEIERRQNAQELIIYENIDNARMLELREMAKKK